MELSRLWQPFSTPIRTVHAVQDHEKGETRAFKQARAFYEGLADRLVASGHALDVFACSLDQVGLDEMRPAVAGTGAACWEASSPLM